MSDTTHTFHPRSDDPRKGLHVFVTASHGEALAHAVVLELRGTLAGLLEWSGAIENAVEQGHGDGSKLVAAIRDAFAKAEDVLSRAGN